MYRSLGLQPIIIAVAREGELEGAIAEMARQRAQALLVVDDPLFAMHSARIMNAALKHALPTIVETREMLESGALLSYAFSHPRSSSAATLPLSTRFSVGQSLPTCRSSSRRNSCWELT